jgi:glycosyltransferase involved in cell wall biosynthesis
MRILHVLGTLDRGGVETWLVQVLRHIDREKYQMDFLVHTTEPGAYDDEVLSLGSRVIPCLRPSNPAMYARNFRRVLRKYGPYDVVHSHVHHYSGYVLMLAATSGVPVRIAHSHSDTSRVDGRASLWRQLYLAAMQAAVRRAATCGLAVSTEAGTNFFGTGAKAFDWKIQPLGIDLSGFVLDVDKRQIRTALGIPNDAFVIGHVGRFSPPKNHSFLIEIAREVISRHKRVRFLLVGDGELRFAIQEKARQYCLDANLIFAGARSDVAALMKAGMDVLLFPSRHEGLPLTLLEAQAAGLHCVISDTISREVDVIPALVHRVSLQQSASHWAVCLLELSAATTHPLAESGREAMKAHSISASTRSLITTYENLCPL